MLSSDQTMTERNLRRNEEIVTRRVREKEYDETRTHRFEETRDDLA
jgi:hypothetical protein